MKCFSIFITTLLLSIAQPQHTSAGQACGALFQTELAKQIKGLSGLGYDLAVAERIVQLRPDIAVRILSSEDQSLAQAVTLYRGVAKPPHDVSAKHSGEANFFSLSIRDAIDFASRYGENDLSHVQLVAEGRTIGTILQIQLPRFLFQDDIPGSFYPQAKLVRTTDASDFTPFISQIGILDVTHPRSHSNFLTWLPYSKRAIKNDQMAPPPKN